MYVNTHLRTQTWTPRFKDPQVGLAGKDRNPRPCLTQTPVSSPEPSAPGSSLSHSLTPLSSVASPGPGGRGVSRAYLSPHARGLRGRVLLKLGQQLGRHVLHLVLVAKGHIHPPVAQCAHQRRPSSSVAPGCVLLVNRGIKSQPRLEEPLPTPQGLAQRLVPALGRARWLSSRFKSQDGLGPRGSMKRYSGSCWCGHIPGKLLPFATYGIPKRQEGPEHMCAFPGCSPKNYTKAKGHRKHLCTTILTKSELKRSSNTDLGIKRFSQGGQFSTIFLANSRYFSPLPTGWSFSSSQHHPSPFPFCPAPRAKGNRIPLVTALYH